MPNKCVTFITFLWCLHKSHEVTQPKILAKNSNSLFFYSNLYLHFLRPSCENIFKTVSIGNKSRNSTYCSSLQRIAAYQWNRKYFTRDVLRLRCQLMMALWHDCHLFNKESKYDWSLHEGRLHDWINFILYLLQSSCFSKYSAKATNFPSWIYFFIF